MSNAVWTQLLGIVQCEWRLQWRRLSTLVIVITYLLISAGYLSVLHQKPPADEAAVTFGVLFSFAPIALLLAIVTLPAAMAETLPRDRHYHVNELVAATPTPRHLYLLGRLGGGWLTVVVTLSAIALLNGVVASFLIGPLDFGVFWSIWFGGIVPAVLLLTGLAILLAATQPNRRRAILVGSGISVVCILLLPIAITQESYSWVAALNPSSWLLVVFSWLRDYALSHGGQPGELLPAVPAAFAAKLWVMGVVELILAGVVAWWFD